MTLNMIAMNCRFSAVGIAHNGSAAWRGAGLITTKPQKKYKLLNKQKYVKRRNEHRILPNCCWA
jgi:hypothetical protein